MMEIKLVQEFDFNDKNSLFRKMDNMNDAIVKEIRESEKSLVIVLHKFDDIQGPSGEVIWPYKELEIEYEYEGKEACCIEVYGDRHCMTTPSELWEWVKREESELEMNDWVLTAGGQLVLILIPYSGVIRRKFGKRKVRHAISEVEIQLVPKKITYRWMS